MKNDFSKVIIILLVSVILALAGTVLVLIKTPPKPIAEALPTPVTKVDSTPTLTPKITTDTSDWLTYTNTEIGLTLKYPKNVALNNKVKNFTQISLMVSVDKIADIPEDLPLNMGRVDVLKDKDELSKGQGEGILKLGDIYGRSSYTYSQFEVCSVMFSRKLTFYPEGYRVVITLNGPKDKIMAQMPEYFGVDSANCGTQTVWKLDKTADFETALSKNLGTGVAQEWYKTFYDILDTIDITKPGVTSTFGTVYKNNKYGFELTYQTPYKVLTDKDNLYGYPNGVALIYAGGQAYDVVVEVWDSEMDYQSHYASRIADLTVLKNQNKFITLFDNTGEIKNKQIISSAKLSQ